MNMSRYKYCRMPNLKHILMVVCAVISMLGMTLVYAQTAPQLAEPLTLQTCLGIALEQSSNLRNSRTNVELSRLRVSDSKSQYYPEVSVSGRYMFNDRVEFGFDEPNYDLNVNGNYTLWDHGQRSAGLAQSKSNVQLRQAQLERSQQDVMLSVTRAYYNLIKARKLVEVDLELLVQAQQNTDRVRSFRDAGELIDADVANAELNQANREQGLINDQNALEIAKSDLLSLMGLSPTLPIAVADDTTYDEHVEGQTLPSPAFSLDEAIQLALEQRPEITETAANLESLESSLALAQLQRWPRLTASYDYSVALDGYLQERDAFKNHRSWQAQATLNFPLFDGGRASRQVQQLELQMQQRLEDAAAQERAIAQDVQQAYFDLQRSARTLELSDISVRNALLNLEGAQARFDQQLIILLQLLDAQNSYAQAITTRVTAFYNYRTAQSVLQKAMGDFKPAQL